MFGCWKAMLGPAFFAMLIVTMGSIGRAAEPHSVSDFDLVNCLGGRCSLGDQGDQKLIVLAFLGTECPLAKLYASKLQSLADEFADRGLVVLAINPNAQDSLADMRAFAKDHGLKVPFLKDAHHTLTDEIHATRTPEVFLLDAERIVRYRGRVDDQYGVGEARAAPQREDLRIAIEELLVGKQVAVPVTEPAGCLLGRRRNGAADQGITYADQIAAIVQRHCVECHREGQIGPFSLTEYEDVAAWSEMIDEVVQEGRMPPWHADPGVGSFKNDRQMSDEEKSLIHRWVQAGGPLGDLGHVPPPREFINEWQLSRKPDLVVPMSDEPFQVPATGTVNYQYFVTDPGFTEDKFVSACEVVPGNRRVVHHVLVFALPPGKKILGVDDDGFLFAYVPGLVAQQVPAGMAKRIPKGSKLLFQVHYTPIGTPQEDLSSLGLIFADPDSITHEVYTASATNRRFTIPPGAADHEVESTSRPIPVDCVLLCMSPHMHVRGTRFFYEAILPDGTKKPLLSTPRYDFNWQTSYELTESIDLPKGTVIHCVAGFDNSAENPSNPDPTASVRWGDQTWQEMMIGYFTVAFPRDSGRGGLSPFERQKIVEMVDRRVFQKLDKNGDTTVSRDEVDPSLWALVVVMGMDADGNQAIQRDEVTAWLDRMDNPLDLLDNPVIRTIPDVAKLLKRAGVQ